MSNEPHVKDLIPEYALDSLDEEQAITVSQHLTGCQECQAELRAYQAVADSLAFAAPQAAPPLDLKERLMAKVTTPNKTAQPQDSGISWRHKLAAYFQSTMPAWGLLGLLLIVALGASNLLLVNRVTDLQEKAVSGPLQIVNLTASNAAPEATGLLVISKNGEYGTLVVDHLPLLDESKQYQLWLIRDGNRTDGGVFSVSSEGYGFLEIESAEPLNSYPAFGITIEPWGGSPGPTGERVLGGQL